MPRLIPRARFDTDVGALVVKIGRYPLHHGGVAAIRSLGRVGVPVYAVTEDRFTPAALSRYTTRAFVAPTTGSEHVERLLELLSSVVGRLPGPVVAYATDDESAVFLAEHGHDLGGTLLTPAVRPALPRQLTSKRGLYELCRAYGFPTPLTMFPANREDVEQFATEATFPVVVKNLEAFERLRAPTVNGTTIVPTELAFAELIRDWPDTPAVALQEYVPDVVAEDWVFHGYFNARSECLVEFTGVKHRSWPPRAGVTAFARAVDNEVLASRVRDFCRRLGYAGVVDLDIRLDRRDQQYKLVDFNPRPGAQFRAFETEAGIDVVRAMHLDLTGRAVPASRQIAGRRFVVEHLDVPAMLAYRRVRAEPISIPLPTGPVEVAWWSTDDVMPFVSMCARYPTLLSARMQRLGRKAGAVKQPRASGNGSDHA